MNDSEGAEAAASDAVEPDTVPSDKGPADAGAEVEVDSAAAPPSGDPVQGESSDVPPVGQFSVGTAPDASTASSAPAEYGSCEEALEDALTSLEQVTAERDEYLDLARRGQAEFENYKRRVDGQRVEQAQRAAEALVVELLPVLDACEAALGLGAEDVAPIHAALWAVLDRQGLAPITEGEVAFDPAVHEAVLTEPPSPDDEPGQSVVAEILRTGYSWNGRVLRPAMVKVRG